MLFSLDTILRCLSNVPFHSIPQHLTDGPKPALNLTHGPSLYVYKLAQYNGHVMYQPRAIATTPPTCIGALQCIDYPYDLPSKADIDFWTHGDDDKDMVHAMLDALEDPKDPLNGGKAYIKEVTDD